MKKLFMILFLMLSLSISVYSENNNIIEVKSRKAFDVEGNKYIIRPFYGIATKSDIGELVAFKNLKDDPNNGKIVGIQVERYVYKDVFNMPLDVTLQGSFIAHFDDYEKKQNEEKPEDYNYYTEKNSYEVNFGIKMYWKKFPWDKYVRTRLGASEGLSYINRVTNLERLNLYQKNQSNYLNYIDVTLSFNAKDITRIQNLEDTYIGIGISHRSGVFGNINGVDGGSNNVTLFFETEM